MTEYVDGLLISFQGRAIKAAERFKDESGVAAFVATILLIVIVVSLTALFWDAISKWFIEIWEKITGKSGTIGGM